MGKEGRASVLLLQYHEERKSGINQKLFNFFGNMMVGYGQRECDEEKYEANQDLGSFQKSNEVALV